MADLAAHTNASTVQDPTGNASQILTPPPAAANGSIQHSLERRALSAAPAASPRENSGGLGDQTPILRPGAATSHGSSADPGATRDMLAVLGPEEASADAPSEELISAEGPRQGSGPDATPAASSREGLSSVDGPSLGPGRGPVSAYPAGNSVFDLGGGGVPALGPSESYAQTPNQVYLIQDCHCVSQIIPPSFHF